LAEVVKRVEVRVGDAHDLLPGLEIEGPFDFIFIDAEKQGYPAYLDWAVVNLRSGGVLAAHNTFRHGAVVDPNHCDPATKAIHNFNRRLAEHPTLGQRCLPCWGRYGNRGVSG
jgi:predicted O-methyltransferase YrrM